MQLKVFLDLFGSFNHFNYNLEKTRDPSPSSMGRSMNKYHPYLQSMMIIIVSYDDGDDDHADEKSIDKVMHNRHSLLQKPTVDYSCKL